MLTLQSRTIILALAIAAFPSFTPRLFAQTWTAVSLPNVGACALTPGGSTSPSNCDLGTGTASTSEPTSVPGTIYNPGGGNTHGGVYTAGCYYLNGTDGSWGGSPLWQYTAALTWVRPGLQKVNGPAYWAYTNQISAGDAFYGIEVKASFQDTTNDGDATVFYTDNICFSGSREYGIRYNYPSQGLQLYWSMNTNCTGNCWADSSYTTAVSETSNACTINTNTGAGGIAVTSDYIYDIYFTMNGSTPTVNCIIKDAGTLLPLSTNYFTGPSGFSWDSTNHIWSGPVGISTFTIPATFSNYGAGWIVAASAPRTNASPSGNANMVVSWVKAAK